MAWLSFKMDATFIPQTKHGFMDEDEESLGPLSSSSTEDSSSSSEFIDDTASSESSSSSSSSSSTSPPSFDMSSLKGQLHLKRGLSNYYEGKSQSFTSFSDIRCLEDLAKPEMPLKRLKLSRSCEGGLDSHRPSVALRCCNKRTITKKAPNSSIRRRMNCLLGSKPPLCPQRPSNLSDQSLWFA